jgi:hypothetical protein
LAKEEFTTCRCKEFSIDLIHFTSADWERVKHSWNHWWQGDLDRPLVMVRGTAPGKTPPQLPNYTSHLPLDTTAGAILDLYQADLEATAWYGDAFPKIKFTFGAGIAAGFLGAQVKISPETVWFEPADQISIQDLHLGYDPGNFWWQRVQELTRLAVERWGEQVCVAYIDLGGNLDILASLLSSQQLLFDLLEAPDEVSRLVAEINRLWLRYYDILDDMIRFSTCGTTPWAPIWSPERCYMLQSDIAYMISPSMFTQFVLPDLESCCHALEYPFYHLDGKGQIRHLDILSSIDRLCGIQWIPGEGQPPPEEWLPLLKRIREAGKLCQLFVSPEGARTIVRELGGRGFALDITESMSSQEAEGFLQVLAAEDLNA